MFQTFSKSSGITVINWESKVEREIKQLMEEIDLSILHGILK